MPFSTASRVQLNPTQQVRPQDSSQSESSSVTIQTISGVQATSLNSMSSQKVPVKLNSSTHTGGVSTGQHPDFTIQIGQANHDLRVVLGIRGKRRCLDIDQIELGGQVKNDGELVSRIMTAHNEIRGRLRLWFSVYQLRFYTFSKVSRLISYTTPTFPVNAKLTISSSSNIVGSDSILYRTASQREILTTNTKTVP